jgi:DNA-binding transcriptional MocR family regulator
VALSDKWRFSGDESYTFTTGNRITPDVMKQYRYEAVAAVIETHIRAGRYKPGDKLPSVRDLKEKYGASVTTIQKVYEQLIVQGLVVNIPRSGYYVSREAEQPAESAPVAVTAPVTRDTFFSSNLAAITSRDLSRHALAEFNVAAAGDLLLPQKLILRTMQQVIREHGVGLLRYYPSNGAQELREHIVQRAARHHTNLHPDELIITDGALQALYIALSAVCAAGDIIAVESPCVFSVLEVARTLRLRIVEIPIDSHAGLDLDHFKRAAGSTAIRAIVVTPNFQNPTGTLLSEAQKRNLLQIAQQYGIAIIENDLYGDLYFTGKRPSNIRSYDESGLVLTYSSYSKTLAGGIRLGWLSPGRYFRQAEQIKFSLGSTVAPVYQETVNKLLSTNSYDRHIRAFRAKLAKQAHHTVQLVSAHFPEGTQATMPDGGYHLWVQLPEATDMQAFYEACNNIGVRFTPGSTFSFSGRYQQYFRLVFADQYSREKEKAIKQAGAYAKRICTP